jgi:two-component sensor histidine kinase
VHPDDIERALQSNRDCVEGRVDSIGIEYRMKAKDGQWRWIYARGMCVRRDERGRALRLVGTHVDITGRKMAEERLVRHLAEKEVLLREVHHRVKNNLNVISSLLNLQASTIKNPEHAIAAFQNSRERVMAMAMVHEELYKSRDYAHVDMEDYLGKLTRQLSLVYGARGDIRLEAQAKGVSLSVSASIPCGLILNELITNAYKYAYPAGRQGSIRVSMSAAPDGMVELVVADDGIGLPAGYVEEDRQASGSLGLTLVRLLVEQLCGSMKASSQGGTAFNIRFPGVSET